MKRGFYLKLAWSGIRKNRRLYTPYLLTCVGMVMSGFLSQRMSGARGNERRYDLAVDAVLRKLGNRRLCPDFSLLYQLFFDSQAKKGIWFV